MTAFPSFLFAGTFCCPDRQLAFLLRREMTGLRIEVRIESRGDDDEVEIELVEGRPNDPIGEIEHRSVLDSGKGSGFKGTVVLSAGDPILEKWRGPPRWVQ